VEAISSASSPLPGLNRRRERRDIVSTLLDSASSSFKSFEL